MINIHTFWAKLAKKEKVLAYVALVCLFLSFFDMVILKTILNKMASIEEGIRNGEWQIRKNIKFLAQKESIEQEGQVFSVYAIEAKTSEEEISSVLREIETLASQSGVTLIEVKPADVKSEKIIKRYSINLTCEATMEQLAKFMYLLENSKIIFTIDTYGLVSKDKEKGTLKCNMVISKIVIIDTSPPKIAP